MMAMLREQGELALARGRPPGRRGRLVQDARDRHRAAEEEAAQARPGTPAATLAAAALRRAATAAGEDLATPHSARPEVPGESPTRISYQDAQAPGRHAQGPPQARGRPPTCRS